MKKGSLKSKCFEITVVLSLFLNTPFSLTHVHYALAIEPNSKNIVNYYANHLPSKHQCISGPCWAFANVAILETFLCKKGILKQSLSEKHLLSWANQPQNSSGWHISLTHGGSSNIAKGYLMSGAGPISSKSCPYTTCDDTFTPKMASCRPLYWVKGVKEVEQNIDSVKDAISKYGAVAIAYPSSKSLNHAVAVIGWDDSTKEWIVKDSASRPSNYRRLPFSTKILDCYCITDAEIFKSNQKIYQHDYYGVNGGISTQASLVVANVFDFVGNETLDAVAVYSTSKNARITLYIAPTYEDGTPCAAYWKWVHLYTGSIPQDGYSTFKLKTPIKLCKGKYAIVARIEKEPRSSGLPNIGCQTNHGSLRLNANTNNCSFILRGPYFVDFQKYNQSPATFSIKAITFAR